MKRLVSKKKRRFENAHFDLDLSYITKRVIAMGFPTIGCESMIRNSATEMKNFFSMYHKDFKVENRQNNKIFIKIRFTTYV